jgi:bifunctional DNA-binding transcriptional regulator/antitoxin component of YhaV-PrlF toxin-antitoxin module
MSSTVRRVDRQGRIALPRNWRSKKLKESREVVVTEHEEILVIRPRRKIDLTEFFDSVKVDVDPKAFTDYSLLKQALLTKTRET